MRNALWLVDSAMAIAIGTVLNRKYVSAIPVSGTMVWSTSSVDGVPPSR